MADFRTTVRQTENSPWYNQKHGARYTGSGDSQAGARFCSACNSSTHSESKCWGGGSSFSYSIVSVLLRSFYPLLVLLLSCCPCGRVCSHLLIKTCCFGVVDLGLNTIIKRPIQTTKYTW